jgi:transposase
MPTIGLIMVPAIVAIIGGPHQFRTGRVLAVWFGLDPFNRSSRGKERLGKITKKADRYIRTLLFVGMTPRAVMAKRSSQRGVAISVCFNV